MADSIPSSTLLTGERRVLELIATCAPLEETLDALCHVIDEESGLRSSIYRLDHAGSVLTLAAAPDVPEVWRTITRSVRVTPTAGACGAALTARKQVIVPDVLASPLYEPWRDAARASGIAAAWSTPFFSKEGRALGTFVVFGRAIGTPSDEQLKLVERATYLATIAIERHDTEQELRESERRFSTVFYSNPASLAISRFSDGRFLYVNDRFVSLFGYSREEAVGQTAIGLGLHASPLDRAEWLKRVDTPAPEELEAVARTKSGELLDLLLWMGRVQVLGEDCILAIACDITGRKTTARKLAESERLLRLVLDTLPVGVAVVNRASDIILNNPASDRIWSAVIHSGRERYARTRAWWHDTGKEVEPEEWASTRALLAGESALNEVVDIEAFDGVRKVIQNSAVPIRDANEEITGAVIINEDISARDAAERNLNESLGQMRALAGRLLRAQDDERRRIAQMLHETTAQDLAALKMQLARLKGVALSEADGAALAESIELADRSMTGIRTLSYVLHPPFLDEAGLLSALRWYVSGFSERSGIEVALDLPDTLARLPRETETALFRVVQEALLNIHHHAHSPTALIRLRTDARHLTLEIEDHGRGMPPALVAELPTGGVGLGVGVAGMRERLQQLGGTLEIQTSDRGTTVRVQIPLTPQAPM
jgi:PAS domain S-box-containing protein